MMRRILMAGLVIAVGCGLAKAEDLVGSLASPDRLIFRGCKAVREKEIRRELETDWQVQVAAAPSMPLNAYLYTLQKRLREGFLASGFVQPKVSVDLEGGADGHIVATIDEGPRYYCGGIRVTGKIGAIPVDRLIERLESEFPIGSFTGSFKDPRTYQVGTTLTQSSSGPVWKVGEMAPFGSDVQDRLDSDVQGALQYLGYFNSHTKAQVETTGPGKAELHIDFLDPGTPTLLDHVEVVGNKISKAADIQKLIGLVPGQPVGLGDLLEVQHRFWDSARFYKHLLTATSSTGGKWARIDLKVDVGEVSGLPPLDEPLSDADQALLRCGRWFLDGLKSGDDLVLDIRTPPNADRPPLNGTFVIGLVGAAFHWHQTVPTPTTRAANSVTSVEYAGELTPTVAGLFSITDQRKFLLSSANPLSWILLLHYEPKEDDGDQRHWNINISASRQIGVRAEPGLHLSMKIAPGALLDSAHQKGVHSRIEGGKLVIDGEDIQVRADAATGRLEKFWWGGDKGGVEIMRRRGALTEEITALGKTGGETNFYDPQHAFASFIAFVADQTLRSPWVTSGSASPEVRGKAIAGKLLASDVFEPFDRLMDGIEDSDATFLIPAPPGQKVGGFTASTAMFVFPHTNDLFEHGSWPWTLSRQALLVLAQHPESFEPELKRIVSDDRMGPVGFLAAAKFLQPYSPQTSTALAGIGLGQLDARHFQVDIDAWTTGNCIVPQSLRRLAQRLRELSDVDMDALATMVPPEVAKVLRQFRTALRAHANEAIEKALPEVLQLLWADSCQNMVGTALHQIADAH